MNSKSSNNRNKKGESTTTIPCKLCPENFSDNDHAIFSAFCQTWIHIKYDNLDYMDYKYLQGCDETWHCPSCTNTLFPFVNLNNLNFLTFTGDNNTISNETKNLNSSLVLEPPPDLAFLFNQFNNAIPENSQDVTDFNNNFLNNLLKKINQEQKKSVSFR